jgi:integrase
LAIRRTLILVDGRVRVGEPKTRTSRRTIELDTHTTHILRKHRAAQLKERVLAGESWEHEDRVFTNEIGRPIRPDWVSRRFSRLVAASNLPRITFHQLRHGHATALLAAGVNPRIAQERLGHHHPRLTMAAYQAVLPNMQKEAAERISAVLGAAASGIGDDR